MQHALKHVWVLGLLAACSSGEAVIDAGPSDSGTVDTGVMDSGVDAGVTDTGPIDIGAPPPPPPRDCSVNPFSCVEGQLLSESCRCLPACEAPLIWNPNTYACIPPPAGECQFDSDCPFEGEVCLDFPNAGPIAPCNNTGTCRCGYSCNPFVARELSGCPANDANGDLTCTWLGDPKLPLGLCLGTGLGSGQAAPCPRGNECNRQQNFFCTGGGGQEPGRCAKLCDVQDQALCNGLGNFDCVDLQNAELPGIGFCRDPIPDVTDVGETCTSSTTCDSGLCSQILSGSCSIACGGLRSCTEDSLCITFTGNNLPPGESAICMQNCSGPNATGDAECSALNPATICRQLVAAPAPALCSPPCTLIGCAPTQTCDPNTGRCM